MKNWLIGIVCVCAFSGLIEILIPDGKNKKAFKVVSAIALLSVFLYPLKNIDQDALSDYLTFDSLSASSDFQSGSDSAVLSAFESGIRQALADRLSDYGISAESLQVECRMVQENIEIEKITVSVENTSDKANEEIKTAIRDYLSEDIEIELIRR